MNNVTLYMSYAVSAIALLILVRMLIDDYRTRGRKVFLRSLLASVAGIATVVILALIIAHTTH